MKRSVVCIGNGERHSVLLARQLDKFDAIGEPRPYFFLDTWPEGSPSKSGWYAAYRAKPFAMKAAWESGATTLVWMDAACYPIKRLDPLFEHVESQGYYLQDNGWYTGTWCSDAALEPLRLSREGAMTIPEISTMGMGLDMRLPICQSFLLEWCDLALREDVFPGFHTNDTKQAAASGVGYRNPGFVSRDLRVLGHRHDQTAASVLAYRRGWTRTPRPVFFDYKTDPQDERTLVVNRG